MEGIKERIKEYMTLIGDTRAALAEYLGISYQALNKKINGQADFKCGEIAKIKKRYNLRPEEIDYIFFSEID